MKKRNILIVHGNSSIPLVSAVRDLLFCFDKYAKNSNCFYLNLNQVFDIPSSIFKVKYDLVIFHTMFLSGRWGGSAFFQEQVLEKALPLLRLDAVKVLMVQDEWIHTNDLVAFINHMDIRHVFSVAPESEWPVIYKGIDFNKVKMHLVLTGYIDDARLKKIRSLAKTVSSRDIDIGYRAYKAPPWLGKHGYLKTRIAEVFREKAPGAGLKIDISNRPEDTIAGDKWYTFMSRCRYFIGVEGGSTIHDPDGKIWDAGSNYMKTHPDATFEEVEKACFPGLDGNLKLIAISPRHLEACITRTCQILVEGSYNGILKSGLHYLELKSDFSNLDELLQTLNDEPRRLRIVERAYTDMVESGLYSYRSFVNNLIDSSLANVPDAASGSLIDGIYLVLNRRRERRRWKQLIRARFPNKLKSYLKYNLSVRIRGRLGKMKNLVTGNR